MQLINIKKGLILSISLLFMLFSGCKDQKTEQKQLQEEVIKTHDELMGKMDLLMNNKSDLIRITSQLDSLKSKNPTLDTVQLKSEIEHLKIQLISSDDAMMQWMNNFNTDYTGKNSGEIIKYLQDQKIKIDSVKTLFKQSLSKSGSLLIKYK